MYIYYKIFQVGQFVTFNIQINENNSNITVNAQDFLDEILKVISSFQCITNTALAASKQKFNTEIKESNLKIEELTNVIDLQDEKLLIRSDLKIDIPP